tara:strand:+ start:3438 stop:3704 length:267 start_codon:yes stop_codon:yes gene_type:complete
MKTIAKQACTILKPAPWSAMSIPTDRTIQKVTVQIQNAVIRREFFIFLSRQLPTRIFITARAAERKIAATKRLQILCVFEISLSSKRL